MRFGLSEITIDLSIFSALQHPALPDR